MGKDIARRAGMKHIHLELGGNGAAIVTDRADLELAARQTVHGALNFSGQRCDAVSRILVDESVAEGFVPLAL